VHWRFSDAGQLSLPTVSSLPASKNQHNNGHSDPKFADTILLKAHPKGPLNFKPDDRGSRGNQWL
jgi:hypothetical protein